MKTFLLFVFGIFAVCHSGDIQAADYVVQNRTTNSVQVQAGDNLYSIQQGRDLALRFVGDVVISDPSGSANITDEADSILRVVVGKDATDTLAVSAIAESKNVLWWWGSSGFAFGIVCMAFQWKMRAVKMIATSGDNLD